MSAKINEGKLRTVPDKCILCGSALDEGRPYLAPRSESAIRDFAYLLPTWFLKILALPNTGGHGKLNSVITNKKFFARKNLYWCDRCCTGLALPLFGEAELSSYYQEFYWNAREQHRAYFNKDLMSPRDSSLNWARSQLDWVASHGVDFSTAIDFGAGDCAGVYVMSEKCGAENVCVVDSSLQTQSIAESMGIRYSSSLDGALEAEFLFGSHSIEHVADLIYTFKALENRVCDGGHVFLETPNVADKQVFDGLVMTPHTFMLSEASFREMSKSSRLKLIAVEAVGPEWCKHHRIASQARTDLRVMFKKIST